MSLDVSIWFLLTVVGLEICRSGLSLSSACRAWSWSGDCALSLLLRVWFALQSKQYRPSKPFAMHTSIGHKGLDTGRVAECSTNEVPQRTSNPIHTVMQEM